MNPPPVARVPRRLRLVLYGLLALASLAAGLALYLFSTVLAAPLPAFQPARTVPLTDVHPYGANFFLEREVEAWKRERTLSMAQSAGIAWARQQFPWQEIEPAPGEYNWAKYDQLVTLFTQHDIQVIARLDSPPAWARTHPSGSGASGPPDDLNTYGDFVEAFARHFKGRIYYLQIWNEPNLGREWNDAPIDPAAYVRLLKTAYARARAVDPNIRILTAPLAITLGEAYPKGEHVFRNMSDLMFLEEMYEAGAKDSFDILSANAFGLGSPPEDPPDPGKLNFQRVVLEREIMERYGDASKPVWINEYGWNASPENMAQAKLFWGRVSEEQQADYTLRGIEYARRNWPWAGVICVWFFRQVGDIPLTNSEYYFRMVDVNFTPRPVYARLAQVASVVPVLKPGEYEETNRSIQYAGQWTPVFDPRASGQSVLATTDPGAGLTLRFWGDGISLRVDKAPGNGRLTVSVDGRPVGGLAQDSAGRSFVELSAAQEAWQSVVPVAVNLTRGEHQLTASVSGQVQIDGVIVPALVSTPPPWPLLAGFLVVGAAAAVLFLRQLRTP